MPRTPPASPWSPLVSGRGFNAAMAAPWYRNPQYNHGDREDQEDQDHHHGVAAPSGRISVCCPGRGVIAKSRLAHCVVACLVRGGKVLTPGLAMCSEGSPRLRPHLSRLLGGYQPKSMTQHAEVAALNRLPEGITLRQLRQMILVVIRPKYSQKLGRTRMLCAQPCRECAQIIFRLGIKAVLYSSEDALHRRSPAELLSESLPSSGTEWLLRDER
mmetsp:Transcript_79151/g.220031  ORF Transcript_79151/g.220031 Transcript_79151/m.220031 type:complete len:215 (+) Transcript_79151:208-852(+)